MFNHRRVRAINLVLDIALTRERETCYTLTHHDCTFTQGSFLQNMITRPSMRATFLNATPASRTLS